MNYKLLNGLRLLPTYPVRLMLSPPAIVLFFFITNWEDEFDRRMFKHLTLFLVLPLGHK